MKFIPGVGFPTTADLCTNTLSVKAQIKHVYKTKEVFSNVHSVKIKQK